MERIVINEKENIDISNIKVESTATNASLFCYIENKGLLLINFPDAWDFYCTFYATNIIDNDFKSTNTTDLLKEMEEFYKSRGIDSTYKKGQLVSLLKETYNFNYVELSDRIHNFKVIKYSKTGLKYRVYDMDFYCLKEVDDINKILNYKGMPQVFIPLDYDEGTVEGKTIVDNVIPMIHDQEIRSKIIENIIKER